MPRKPLSATETNRRPTMRQMIALSAIGIPASHRPLDKARAERQPAGVCCPLSKPGKD